MVDNDNFKDWQQASGVTLKKFPHQRAVTLKKKATAPCVRATTLKATRRTKPLNKDGRAIIGYKRPVTHNSVHHSCVPSQMVVNNKTTSHKKRQPAVDQRIMAELRSIREDLVRTRRKVDRLMGIIMQ